MFLDFILFLMFLAVVSFQILRIKQLLNQTVNKTKSQ